MTQPCRPGRYQPRSAKQKHIWRGCISAARCRCISTAIRNKSDSIPGPHSRVDRSGISTAKAVYQQQSKTKAKALLVATACRLVRYINRDQHIRRNCISPARCRCISTDIRNKSKSIPGPHSRVAQRGISTAKAVYQQQSKTKAKPLLVDKACRPVRYINRYQHIRRNCISPARCRCISTDIRNISESIPGPHSRVDQSGILTAKAVYQQQSKTKAKPLLVDTAASTWAVS